MPAVRPVRAREVPRFRKLRRQGAPFLAAALWARNTHGQNKSSTLPSICPACGSALRLWRKACHSCAQERMLDRVGREKGCSFGVESSNAEDITRGGSRRV